ncbi:hypothetical protein NDN08_006482 [Rhodosorus marinus]|uniref:20 kDa chaperonin, chloroplastic n=1 Tax=Rhodosorus marinus TaxID=101924 RepID=A0AAV8UHW2_9RHOD|nr:hypothetical protein NDN08_006482 [Rhodosorus marinus]
MVEAERHFIDEVEVFGMPKAVRNNVLVECAEAEEVTSGGLILATTTVEKPNYGVVKSVGTGYRYPTTGVQVPMVIKPGDCVIYGSYGVDEVLIDDEDHVFVSQDAVLAKVSGDYKAANVEPIYDTMLVRRDSSAEELGSGLMLSAKAQSKPNTGTILSVGNGRLMEGGEFEPIPYAVGDRVIFASTAGTPVKFEGAEHVLVRVVEVLAKVE